MGKCLAGIHGVPLRKVVERKLTARNVWLETLNCGHTNSTYGEYPCASRRRCRRCAFMADEQGLGRNTKQRQKFMRQLGRKLGNATVTPEQQSSSAKPSDTTRAKKTVIVGG